jgi:hypothetical protein
LTLTYPSTDPVSAFHAKHLDTLIKRIRRMAPDASLVWKLEYTKQETPHFHLLVLNLNRWAHEHLAQTWAQIVRSEHPDHLSAGTRVERVCSKRHVARYIAKYVGKTSALPANHVGRIWGKAGPISMAMSIKHLFLLTYAQYLTFRRIADEVRKGQNRRKWFDRRSALSRTQRWFLSGAEVIRYLKWSGACPILDLGPAP